MENANRNKLKKLLNSIVDVLTDEARAEAVEEHKKKEALGAVRSICIENERLKNVKEQQYGKH